MGRLLFLTIPKDPVAKTPSSSDACRPVYIVLLSPFSPPPFLIALLLPSNFSLSLAGFVLELTYLICIIIPIMMNRFRFKSLL